MSKKKETAFTDKDDQVAVEAFNSELLTSHDQSAPRLKSM